MALLVWKGGSRHTGQAAPPQRNIQKIISSNWNQLGKKFSSIGIDNNRFQVYMDDLNAGRTDADHYDAEDIDNCPDKWDIDDTTIQRFCIAKEALEKF